MERRKIVALIVIVAIATMAMLAGCINEETPMSSPTPAELPPKQALILSTTTSLYDTGLLDYLKPVFDEKYNADLRIVYAGTGKALEYGMRGDVDVLAVHDRVREDQFIADGYGINRRCFAYNYFVIVGPESDPAGIQGMTPEDAFRTIREKGRTNPEIKFVSRGDASGTHALEQRVWKSAGFDYGEIRNSTEGWYVEAGSGMGPTLVMANEKAAYTVADIGTFLAFKGQIQLVPLVEKGDILLNVYGVMAVDPEKQPHVNITMADNFINFLISNETQQMIGEFGVKEYGTPLFYPLAGGKCKELYGCPTWEECAKPATYEP
jgi:tungstate transport system substrate-binding protein